VLVFRLGTVSRLGAVRSGQRIAKSNTRVAAPSRLWQLSCTYFAASDSSRQLEFCETQSNIIRACSQRVCCEPVGEHREESCGERHENGCGKRHQERSGASMPERSARRTARPANCSSSAVPQDPTNNPERRVIIPWQLRGALSSLAFLDAGSFSPAPCLVPTRAACCMPPGKPLPCPVRTGGCLPAPSSNIPRRRRFPPPQKFPSTWPRLRRTAP
jgi:hypothetical protein